jgi:hypothetical protein
MTVTTLTVDQVARALPPNLKGAATQQLVDQLNNLQLDPEHAEEVRNNFLSYTKVLQDGRFKTQDYLNAVKYVSFKLMGYSNQDAYCRTFPQRHADLIARGADPQEVSAYVSMYAKGKLPNLIMEQSLVPSWVLNQDLHQRGINQLAHEMVTANSAHARIMAATALVQATAKPKEAGPLVSIDLRENSGVNELRETMKELVNKQLEMIENGTSTTKDIAGQKMIDVTPVKS